MKPPTDYRLSPYFNLARTAYLLPVMPKAPFDTKLLRNLCIENSAAVPELQRCFICDKRYDGNDSCRPYSWYERSECIKLMKLPERNVFCALRKTREVQLFWGDELLESFSCDTAVTAYNLRDFTTRNS